MCKTKVFKKAWLLLLACVLVMPSSLALASPASPSSKSSSTTEVSSIYDRVAGKTIYYPSALEYDYSQYPVITWANGTLCPTSLYNNLLTEYARGGYVVVADNDVMTKSGESQINSIDYIFAKNEDYDSIFYNKIDTEKVAASGQSQGGLSTVVATKNDPRIKVAVSLAGNSTSELCADLTTPTFFIAGTLDLIVPSWSYVGPSFEAAAGPAAYGSLVGATHTTFINYPEEYAKYGLAWMNAYLYGDYEQLELFTPGNGIFTDPNWQNAASKNLE